jgi:hypothetical protein
VVARIRPLLKSEIEKDQILTVHDGPDGKPTVVKLPNPKNLSEEYSFQFNSVYGQESTQQDIFDTEGMERIMPTRSNTNIKTQSLLQ